MNVKTAKKIGFFAALSISLGSVVGIGIFLKNISVIKAQIIEGTDTFSFISLIVSWIFAALISLCTAFSFTEISTCKIGKAGLSGWIEVLGNKKQGFFAKLAHSGIYFSIMSAVIPILAVEGLYTAINDAVNGTNAPDVDFYWVFIGGIVILIVLGSWNYFSLKSSAKFQLVGTFIKIIPLVLVIIIGFIGANGSHILNDQELINSGNNINESTGLDIIGVPVTNQFNITGMFLALPAILFSFDSFLTIGSMGNDVKNPQKTIPLVAVVTIIVAAIIYIFISIGAGLTGMGDAASIVQTIVGKTNTEALNAISITVNILITFSAIFVANGLSMGTLKTCESIVDEKQIMFYNFFSKLNAKKENLGGFVLYWMQVLFYLIILGIPAIVLNTDAILDSATNAPVLIFFFVYALTIILAIKDRYTKKQCRQVKGFMVAAPISVISILIVFVYVFVYQNIYVVSTINYDTPSTSGLFFSAGKWYKGDDAILFWTLFAWAIIWPTINYFVVKHQCKKENKPMFENENACNEIEQEIYVAHKTQETCKHPINLVSINEKQNTKDVYKLAKRFKEKTINKLNI